MSVKPGCWGTARACFFAITLSAAPGAARLTDARTYRQSRVRSSVPAMAVAEAFDPTGNYVFVGRAPRGFADLKWIAIETWEVDPQDGARRPVAPRGSLWANRELKMARVTLDGDALTFATATAGRVVYEFDGRFLERSVFAERFDADGESKGAVLKGRIVKIANGRKAAESEVSLKWALGG